MNDGNGNHRKKLLGVVNNYLRNGIGSSRGSHWSARLLEKAGAIGDFADKLCLDAQEKFGVTLPNPEICVDKERAMMSITWTSSTFIVKISGSFDNATYEFYAERYFLIDVNIKYDVLNSITVYPTIVAIIVMGLRLDEKFKSSNYERLPPTRIRIFGKRRRFKHDGSSKSLKYPVFFYKPEWSQFPVYAITLSDDGSRILIFRQDNAKTSYKAVSGLPLDLVKAGVLDNVVGDFTK